MWVCRPCHDHIHAVFTEKQLSDHYHSREALLAHTEIQDFVRWIRHKPAGFRPRSRTRKR